MDEAELDAELRSACHALSERAPAGYFDALPTRIQARMEAADMQGSAMSEEKRDKPQTATTAPVTTPEDHEEHSGLHDIQALAESTKKRISRRQSTQSEVDESLLASASASALRAVALPSAGKEVSPPERSARGTGQVAAVAAAAEVSASAAATPAAPAKRSSTWMFAAGAIAVVAAGAIFYLKTQAGQPAPKPAAGEMVAANTAAPAVAAPGLAPTDNAAPPADPALAIADDADKTATDPAAAGADDAPADSTAPDADAKATAGDDDTGSKKSAAKRGDESTASAKPADEKPTAKAESQTDSKTAAAKGTTTAKTEAAVVAPKPPPAGDKSLDDLLSEAAGGPLESAKPKTPAADEGPTKKSLDRSDLQKAMGAVKGKVRACYETHQERGNITVKFVVTPDGAVTGAQATGKFAGTPSGDCVVAAVSGAKLPAFSGAQMSFSYPFLLSD